MKPIRSFRLICWDYGLNQSQTNTLKSLVDKRKGVLHPYWVQIAFNVPYSFAKRLHDDLIANEWVIPDTTVINSTLYETELTEYEVERLARIELGLVANLC
jgi:hypothetical protein